MFPCDILWSWLKLHTAWSISTSLGRPFDTDDWPPHCAYINHWHQRKTQLRTFSSFLLLVPGPYDRMAWDQVVPPNHDPLHRDYEDSPLLITGPLECIVTCPFLVLKCDLSISMLPQLADLGLLCIVFEELQLSVFRYRICQHAIFHIHEVVQHLDRLEATHVELLLIPSIPTA